MKSVMDDLGIKRLSSGLEAYDKMLCDGIPSKMITVDCGQTQTYKTLFNLQKTFSFIKHTKGTVIYVDTEGSIQSIISGWKERFEKCFELPPVTISEGICDYKEEAWTLTNDIDKEGNIIIISIRDLFKMFEIHGTPIDIKITENGRMDVKRKAFVHGYEKDPYEELKIEDTPIGWLFKMRPSEPCAMIYDSLIELFKQRIPSTMENFPTRSYLLHNLMGCMQRIAETYNIPVIAIAHTGKNPIYKTEGPTAMSVISYNCKLILMFRKHFDNPMTAKEMLNYREIVVWRHPYKAPMSEAINIKLTDNGFIQEDPPEKKKKDDNKDDENNV